MFRKLLLASLLLTPHALRADERTTLRTAIQGPVQARLISVVDGDTILVEARPWPQHSVTVLVRIRGIDAPELKARCETARSAALRAKHRLADLAHGAISLSNIAGDKYFGRVVANVASSDSDDIGAAMLAQGLVRAYDGGRRVEHSC